MERREIDVGSAEGWASGLFMWGKEALRDGNRSNEQIEPRECDIDYSTSLVLACRHGQPPTTDPRSGGGSLARIRSAPRPFSRQAQLSTILSRRSCFPDNPLQLTPITYLQMAAVAHG